MFKHLFKHCLRQSSPRAFEASCEIRKFQNDIPGRLYKVFRQLFNEPPGNTRVETPLQMPRQEDLKKRRSFYQRFQQLSAEAPQQPLALPESNNDAVEKAWLDYKRDLTTPTQVYTYLLASVPDEEMEPLDFWRCFGIQQFPLMTAPVRYFLGIFASQATAERVFSVSTARHRLSSGNLGPKLLSRLVPAHVNYHAVETFSARLSTRAVDSAASSPGKQLQLQTMLAEDSD